MVIRESVQTQQRSEHILSRLTRAIHAPVWVEQFICFSLGLLLSAAPVAGSPAPFGIAMLAVLGFGSGGFLFLIGALIGYSAGFGFVAGTQMIGGCMLVFTISYFLRQSKLTTTRAYPVCISTIAYGITRATLYWLTGGITVLLMMRVAFFLLLCIASAFLYSDAADLSEPRTLNAEIYRSISVVYVLSTLLLGLSRFVLFHTISVGRILSLLILLILSRTGGPLCGAAAGVVLGVCMDVGTGGASLLSVSYPVSALSAGLFSKHKKSYYLISFLVCQAFALFCLPSSPLRMAALIESSAAGLLFLVLPQKVTLSVSAFVQPQRAGRGESGLRRYVAGQVGSMSHAYRALYDVASAAALTEENDADPAKIFDRSAERVCVQCSRRDLCWHELAGDTYHILSEISGVMEQRGRLESEDFPQRFQDRCDRLHELTEVVNGELRLRAYRRRMRRQVEEDRSVLWETYRDFSEVLSASAKSLTAVHGADPTAERRLIRYLRTIGIEADASVFRDERGRLHAAIESRYLQPLFDLPDYLDCLSAVLGVRLCMPEYQAREDSMILLEAEPLSASIGIAAVKKRGESVSGDRGTYFKTDSGELCVILSDGMGTGDAAAKGSIGTIRILENFLRAGVEPSNAMKLLNASALVRDTENWGYSTVDLMCIDLFTGEARFYKYGAAPSYVRTGNVIRKIRSSSYAAGLSFEAGKSPDVMRMRLKPGSVAVIASDGIVSDGKDLWLRELLEASDEADMKTLAGAVVQTAVREYGRNDDMTALAVKVEVRT